MDCQINFFASRIVIVSSNDVEDSSDRLTSFRFFPELGLPSAHVMVTVLRFVIAPTKIKSVLWYKIAGTDMTKIERESINFKLPKTLTNALRAKAG
ncbi:MAG: hypothetical protein SAL70_36645 [Scytonema sp. PMC 1070.18]|nr:hypothetical protein [Scytonema sp. PMC 1070.18]